MSSAQTRPVVEAWGERHPLESLAQFGRWVNACASRDLLEATVIGESADASARRLERVETLLKHAMVRAGGLDEALANLAADRTLAVEPGWTSLFAGLVALPGEFDDFKVIATAHYRDFLTSRGHRGGPDAVASGPFAGPDFGAAGDLCRLARGRRMAMRPGSEVLGVWLAGQRFELRRGPGATLRDGLGRQTALREGRNLVGRARYAEVAVDEGFVDVSRRHLVIEVSEGRVVAVTDLSSRGTCVPRSSIGGAAPVEPD